MSVDLLGRLMAVGLVWAGLAALASVPFLGIPILLIAALACVPIALAPSIDTGPLSVGLLAAILGGAVVLWLVSNSPWWLYPAPTTALAACALAVLSLASRAPSRIWSSAALSLLMLILGHTFAPTLTTGLATLCWVGLLPAAAILATLHAHPVHRGSHPGALWAGGMAIVLAIPLALVLPRPAEPHRGISELSPAPTRTIGILPESGLDDLRPLLDDPTPALKVALPAELPRPWLLRGVVLERFDGRSWSNTSPLDQPPTERPPGAARLDVDHYEGAGGVIFAAGQVVAVDAAPPLPLPDTSGVWHLPGPARALRYTAWVLPFDRVPAETDPDRWLQLPELDPEVEALSHELLGDLDAPADPLQAARRVEDWLAENTRHTLLGLVGGDDPVASFLLVHREGHCELHATAAALLLRAAGYPTRVIYGYAPPPPAPATSTQLVRRGHAHAWIEVLDPQGRWHTVDPTPGGARSVEPPSTPMQIADELTLLFDDRVIGYSAEEQRRGLAQALQWLTRPGTAAGWAPLLLGAISLLVACVAAYRAWSWLSGRPLPPQGRLSRIHHRARSRLDRAGFSPPPGLPPLDAASWIADRSPEIGAELRALAWLHYRVTYGGEDEGPLIPAARAHLQRLHRAARLTKRDSSRSPGAVRAG